MDTGEKETGSFEYVPRSNEKCVVRIKDFHDFACFSVRILWITDMYVKMEFIPGHETIYRRNAVEFTPSYGRGNSEYADVSVSLAMFADCPNCGTRIDLTRIEKENEFSFIIFSVGSRNEKLEGMEILCPECLEPIILGSIELGN